MSRRTAALLAVVASGVLAGCSGNGDGNGVAELGADEILVEAHEAADAAGSVHMTGSFEFGGMIGLDITADRSGGMGTVTVMDMEFEVLSVGGIEYMRAGADLWGNVMGDPAAVDRAADQWVKGSAGGAAGIDVSGFLDLDSIVEGILVPDGELAKGEETVVDGRAVIGLQSEDGSTLYIATEGEALPVQLAPPEGEPGSLDLEWGVDAEIIEPDVADVIDHSEIE